MEEVISKYKLAWTEERRKLFGEYIKQRYIDEPKYREMLSDIHLGKPKTEEQKVKMSKAKLGVSKSPEHRAAMSAAHKRRAQVAYMIMEKFPKLTYREALIEYRSDRQGYDAEYDASLLKDS